MERLPALPHRGQRFAVPGRRLRAGELRVLRQDPQRPEGTEAALEARAGHHRERCRRRLRPAVCEGRLLAGSQGEDGRTGEEPGCVAEGTHPGPELDERGTQGQGHRQVGNLHPEDRLPGQVA
ncbi:hypothetical protein G6F60_014995 [Rhizopus arrhizus]|nr:hypothetical protein G6F60_014995 [Rhizopus arrhizus]